MRLCVMFSRKDQLIIKTGEEGVGRYDFLKQIAEEFQKTNSHEAQRQVLANLANFAYDPINYDFMRDLQILDIFLAQLSGNKEDLLQFGVAALCNLCSDPLNREYIIRSNGIFLISEQLLHKNKQIAIDALTTLIFLITQESQGSITSPEIISKVLHYANDPDPRCKNLGLIFLQDYCTKEQIDCAKKYNLQTIDIPLPNS